MRLLYYFMDDSDHWASCHSSTKNDFKPILVEENSANEPEDRTPEDAQASVLKTLGSAIEESIAEVSLKPLGKWAIKKAMRTGFWTGVVLIGLAVYVTYSIMNSLRQKQVGEKVGEITAVSNDRDSARRELSDFKTDARESFRQRDEEITRLENKVNSDEEQLAYWKTVPNGILSLATNIVTLQSNGLANPQELQRIITNSLALMNERRPAFEFREGLKVLTNDEIVFVDTNREFHIGVKNVGAATAAHVYVDAYIDVDESNAVALGWQPQPRLQMFPNSCHFTTMSQFPIPPDTGFFCSPLKISTNASSTLHWIAFYAHSEDSDNESVGLIIDLRGQTVLLDSWRERLVTEKFSVTDTNRVAIVPYGDDGTYAVGFVLSNIPDPKSLVTWTQDDKRIRTPAILGGGFGNFVILKFSGDSVSKLRNEQFVFDYIKDVGNKGSLHSRIGPGTQTNSFLLDGLEVPIQ